jgi:hypothetical protein
MKKTIRRFSLWLERRTSDWILPKGLVLLIENTNTPDFAEYDRIVNEREKLWPDDPEIGRAKVLGRFRKFQAENSLK